MRQTDNQGALIVELALRDYRHEWVMSACFVLALSAVLLPLLVLFGLKFGIISNLLSPLTEDPRYRQIMPIGSGKFGPDWFEAMAARPDVEFIVPRTRSIAATIRLRIPESTVGRIIDVELIPSGAGDPVLVGLPAPDGLRQVVLSADAADKLAATAGTRVEGIVTRILGGKQQTQLVGLEVVAVAPAAAFGRDGLFVSGALLVAIEDFKDGRAVAELQWDGSAAREGPRHYSGFRLFARQLDDVAQLRRGLMDQGIDVRTRSADIELVRKLDRNLSIVFWIIAVLAATGYGFSFGSSVWANVDRKRRDFSILRLTGFRTRGIVWFPILQAMLTGILGWTLAVAAFFTVQAGLNALFLDNVGGGQAICRILFWHLLVALALTLLAAAFAATLGGMRVAQLEPSLALRE
jgi:putative ABC transport system permease protein